MDIPPLRKERQSFTEVRLRSASDTLAGAPMHAPTKVASARPRHMFERLSTPGCFPLRFYSLPGSKFLTVCEFDSWIGGASIGARVREMLQNQRG